MKKFDIVIENFLNDEFKKGIISLGYPKTKFNLLDDNFFLYELENVLKEQLID